MKIRFCILFFFLFLVINAQNKQSLYDFNGVPQSLLLNPGARVDYIWHTGVPLLSGISINAGSSGLSIYELFADDGGNFNDKIKKYIYKLNPTDFLTLNEQIEIINAGFRMPNNDYLSFGFYQESDLIFYYPKDKKKLKKKLFFNKKIYLKSNIIWLLYSSIFFSSIYSIFNTSNIVRVLLII